MQVVFALALVLSTELPEPVVLGSQAGDLWSPLQTNESCASCHASDTGKLASDTYRGSLMSLSSYDPVFLAALEIAEVDAPDVSILCVRCHFPAGVLMGRGRADENGFYERDQEGVACDLCHRMEVPEPTVERRPLSGLVPGNAQFYIAPYAGTKTGTYDTDVRIGHESEGSPLFTDSMICGTCHDVTDILVEQKTMGGEPLGRAMPVERTYTEWSQSAFARVMEEGKSCQDCHMKTLDVAPTAVVSSMVPPDREVHDHHLVGSSVAVPLMIAEWSLEEDAPAYLKDIAPIMEETSDLARAQLENDSADLDAIALEQTDDGPVLRVRVTNRTGHKLPTGYSEGRRMFLSSFVVDDDGECGPRTGTMDPETCEFRGDEPPEGLWEIILGQEGEDHTFHFALADRIQVDSRIPPMGFRPNEETKPVGYEFEVNDDGSLAHWDDTLVPLGDSPSWPVTVTARLEFQSTTGDFLRFLVNTAERNGEHLARLWEKAGGGPPVLMREITVRVFEDGRVESAPLDTSCEPTSFADVPANACLPKQPEVDEQPECACAALPDELPASALAALTLLGVIGLRRRRR
jgi:hypothetical protein